MPWIFLALALGCMAIAMKTQSMGIALFTLLGSLVFMLLAALGWISSRIQGRSQPASAVLTPETIAAMRKARGEPAAAPSADRDEEDVSVPMDQEATESGDARR